MVGHASNPSCTQRLSLLLDAPGAPSSPEVNGHRNQPPRYRYEDYKREQTVDQQRSVGVRVWAPPSNYRDGHCCQIE